MSWGNWARSTGQGQLGKGNWEGQLATGDWELDMGTLQIVCVCKEVNS